jgi:hypothetical protein
MTMALILVAIFYLWRLWLLQTLAIDRDEFEHLHAAWLISRGLIPYRDFWEHHTPGFWFMLAPLYRWYPVEQNPDAAVAFIFMARRASMVFAGVCLALTFVLARMWGGDRVAWIAVAMLSTCVAFMYKTLEIRPDVPATALWLGYLASTFAAFRAITTRKQASLFALSGLLLGGAVMCTQKILVALPAIALAMLWYLVAGEGKHLRRLANCWWQVAGFCLPILAMVVFFMAQGALHAFVHYNLATNLNWNGGQSFAGLLPWLGPRVFRENTMLVSLGVVGVLLEAWRQLRDRAFTRDKFLLLATLGAIAGLVELPEAWLQYYLSFLPLLAIYAAGVLNFAVDKAPRLASAQPNSALPQYLAGGALALVLLALSVSPGWEMRRQFAAETSSRQLRQLRWVLLHSSPTDRVLDCWSGLGVFRPNAYFYSMLYGQVLSTSDRERLAADLMSGRTAPKLVFPSHDLLWWVSPSVRTALLKNYMPVPGEGFIFFRITSDRAAVGTSEAGPLSSHAYETDQIPTSSSKNSP